KWHPPSVLYEYSTATRWTHRQVPTSSICLALRHARRIHDSARRDRDSAPLSWADGVRAGFVEARPAPRDRGGRRLEAHSLEAPRRRHGEVHGEIAGRQGERHDLDPGLRSAAQLDSLHSGGGTAD